MTIAAEIRSFIERECLNGEVAADDPLAEGLLDSLAVGQLISFLEKRYDLEFDDQEVVAKNFGSVRAVAALVRTKRQRGR